MKSLKICLFALACLLMFDAQAQAAPSSPLYPHKDCGGKDSMKSLLIAGFGNYPPFSWTEFD